MPATEDILEAIVDTYPNGMTADDIQFEFEAHGKSPFMARLFTRKVLGSATVHFMDTIDAAFAIQHELWNSDRETRRKEILAQVGNASTVQLSNGEVTLFVHPSTRRPGKWQLSRVDRLGPSGHTDHDTFEMALFAAIGAHPDSYWDEGSAKYLVVNTGGSRQ